MPSCVDSLIELYLNRLAHSATSLVFVGDLQTHVNSRYELLSINRTQNIVVIF